MGVLDKILKRYDISDSSAKELTKPPKKSGYKTTFKSGNYPPGDYHQMDLLFLPEDDDTGHKYLLVITDIGSGKTDARPLKTKSGTGVLKEVQSVYTKKKYLKEPKFIHMDAGTEFNATKAYYLKKKIGVRVASVGRHKQQSVVEAMNKIIGSAINELQVHNEMITEDVDRNWVEYLPTILEVINEEAHTRIRKPKPKKETVLCEKTECDLLEIGAKVRVALDYPKNIKNERQHGTFRAGDIRWSTKSHTIENILLLPNQPIRYVISGIPNNTFSKYEIKPYQQNKNQLPVGRFEPEKIVKIYKRMGSKKDKPEDKLSYLVKWKGLSETKNSWETRKKLLKYITANQIETLIKNVDTVYTKDK